MVIAYEDASIFNVDRGFGRSDTVDTDTLSHFDGRSCGPCHDGDSGLVSVFENDTV